MTWTSVENENIFIIISFFPSFFNIYESGIFGALFQINNMWWWWCEARDKWEIK